MQVYDLRRRSETDDTRFIAGKLFSHSRRLTSQVSGIISNEKIHRGYKGELNVTM